MIKPVTSTNVATNGAEEAAGSKPILRRKKGSIDPESVPHTTTPTKEKPTVMATRAQCAPYRFVKADHIAMRRKPMDPRTIPSMRPEKISRLITNHQSFKVISCSAIARIISVAAWEPEFPPLEIIRGTNKARTTAFAISSSK